MVRTIHLAFMPDEEIGGGDGMKKFIEQDDFKKLNVAMALDEGLASPNEVYTVFYGERAAWWVQIYATGNTGHGSRFIENSAVEKLMTIVNKLLQFRKEQFEELQKGMVIKSFVVFFTLIINLKGKMWHETWSKLKTCSKKNLNFHTIFV